MSAKKLTTALLAVTGVIAVTTLSTNASAPPNSTDVTTTTTTVATPVVAGCSTTVTGATTTTVDEAFVNLCDVVLTRKDEGYDEAVTLNGATFKCTSIPAGTTTDFNRSYFENRMGEISAQVGAWRLAKVSNPNAPWAPVNPAKQSCNFPFTSKESNTAATFPVTSTKFGAGSFATTCTTEFKMDTTFVYTMTIPTAAPEGNAMVLPATKAWPWSLGFSGTRSCTWKLTFGSAGELSGTIAQNFGDLPKTQANVAWNCRTGYTKVICVSYSVTSEIIVTGGTDTFAGASGSGIQTDVRILPALLIDMPFEADGTVLAASSGARYKLPVLKLAGTVTKPKSSVSLRFKTKGSTASKKLSYTVSNARQATCSITGKSGTNNITLVRSVKSSSKGLVSTSLTTSTLRSKLKLAAGKTASLTITCGVGKSKVVRRVSQVLK
ncbi:hypothetical protein HQ459_04710 [bacterium]|nr:hypothetical protein [bacterium]